jgi:NAD+ kinase
MAGARLNEMVVTSSGISKVVNLDLTVNQTHAGFFRADGMIIATLRRDSHRV